MTSDKSLNLSGLQFPYLWKEDNDAYFIGLLCKLEDTILRGFAEVSNKPSMAMIDS